MNDIADLHQDMIAWRHDLHAHPELGFQEHRTAEFVATKLAEFGVDVHRGIAGTGVVGTLRAGTGRRAIAFRASSRNGMSATRSNSQPPRFRSRNSERPHRNARAAWPIRRTVFSADGCVRSPRAFPGRSNHLPLFMWLHGSRRAKTRSSP